jgi:hypothetical protein
MNSLFTYSKGSVAAAKRGWDNIEALADSIESEACYGETNERPPKKPLKIIISNLIYAKWQA